MAKGKKTGGKDFVPGDPRAGRPPMPADLKRANALTSVELRRTLNRVLFMRDDELLALTKDASAVQLERIVASIVLAATKQGDVQRMEWLAARLVGKVVDKVEVKVPEPFIVQRRDGSEIVMGAKPKKDEDE
jgi:hypothetical protein